jgi:hypothetical protein
MSSATRQRRRVLGRKAVVERDPTFRLLSLRLAQPRVEHFGQSVNYRAASKR